MFAKFHQWSLSHYFNMHFNIIFSFTPWFSQFSLPFRFSDENVACIFRISCMPRKLYPLSFYHCNIWQSAKRPWISTFCSLLQPPAILSVLVSNINLKNYSEKFRSNDHLVSWVFWFNKNFQISVPYNRLSSVDAFILFTDYFALRSTPHTISCQICEW